MTGVSSLVPQGWAKASQNVHPSMLSRRCRRSGRWSMRGGPGRAAGVEKDDAKGEKKTWKEQNGWQQEGAGETARKTGER